MPAGAASFLPRGAPRPARPVMTRSRALAVAAVAAALGVPLPARADPVVVKLATLAPDGSSWHEALKDLARAWSEASGGRVQLKIYAGGVAGDETAVLSKMRIGQFGAALVTTHGLVAITSHVRAFALPRMIRSYEELDAALAAMRPGLERELERSGYVALGWADAGMVRLFVPEPTASVERLQRFKLFAWAGDRDGVELWRRGGFNPVPVPAPELMTALQTGLVEAFPTTPVIALASQWYAFTKAVVDVPIAPLVGALVLTRGQWERVPEDVRPALRDAAERTVLAMRAENRRLERVAIEAMRRRGLAVVVPAPPELAAWDAKADALNATVRGTSVPAGAYDDLQRVLASMREGARAAR